MAYGQRFRVDRARRVQRIRGLKITEGSLVKSPANKHCEVMLYKSKERPMDVAEIQKRINDPGEAITKADVDALIEDHLGDVAPELSIGEALLKSWGKDPMLSALYAAREAAEPDQEPEPMAKAAEPGREVWQEIRKRALALHDERHGAITLEEATTRISSISAISTGRRSTLTSSAR